MKKYLSTSLIILSIVLSPSLYAQTPPSVTTEPVPVEQPSTPIEETPKPTDTTETATSPAELPADEGTAVGQASTEGMSAAKKRQWTNIALAVGAVAVAVTALILVSNNSGHGNNH